MTTAREKLKKFLEIGARNSKKDAERLQGVHDYAVDMGAVCATVSEAGGFSTGDVYTLLSRAVREKVGKESYPYIADVFDNALVYSAGYGGDLYQADYDVDEKGIVTLGDTVPVVRKVQYIKQSNDVLESTEIELDGECVQLVENGDNTSLKEAKTRMLKLIAPGWGSSGYYPADVLKRDGPNVFKRGLFNFWDHPTAIEEKERPEGSLTRLASVLLEDAKWLDDYAGNGPGLYAPTNTKENYERAIDDLAPHIGMSIRASGKGRAGEAEGRKGFIIEAITGAKSVDYVTIPGAGGKVLDLFESYRKSIKGVETMADVNVKVESPELVKLQETINTLNQRFIRGEADQYVRRKLATLRVKEAVKDRIVAAAINDVPLSESGSVDTIKFDALIEAAAKSEVDYLTSVAGLGKVAGFGESKPISDEGDVDKLYNQFEESLKALD